MTFNGGKFPFFQLMPWPHSSVVFLNNLKHGREITPFNAFANGSNDMVNVIAV